MLHYIQIFLGLQEGVKAGKPLDFFGLSHDNDDSENREANKKGKCEL